MDFDKSKQWVLKGFYWEDINSGPNLEEGAYPWVNDPFGIVEPIACILSLPPTPLYYVDVVWTVPTTRHPSR
jgi:hypothetical protein